MHQLILRHSKPRSFMTKCFIGYTQKCNVVKLNRLLNIFRNWFNIFDFHLSQKRGIQYVLIEFQLFDEFGIIGCFSYSAGKYFHKQLLLLPHMIYKNQLASVLCGSNLGCSMQYDIFLTYTTFSFQRIHYRHFENLFHLKNIDINDMFPIKRQSIDINLLIFDP